MKIDSNVMSELVNNIDNISLGCHGRDRMVVGFTTCTKAFLIK